jgi:hypothetical protein
MILYSIAYYIIILQFYEIIFASIFYEEFVFVFASVRGKEYSYKVMKYSILI